MLSTRIHDILKNHTSELQSEWLAAMANSGARRDALMKEGELREQCAEFLRLLSQATQQGGTTDINSSLFTPVRELLERLSRSRSLQGFTPTETATFIFSFKLPLFSALRREWSREPQVLADELWSATLLLDRLGLFTTEVHQKTREEVIHRQQQEMMELSTPVVQLWDRIVALPLIGTLDSGRTQTVMETLLQRIVETSAEIAILDITGVPTVDTLTAQHLIKTVTATRLMGAECVISGIRPQIAQTIVHLGVDLSGVVTKSSLAGAFSWALKRLNQSVNTSPGLARTATASKG
ncbi:STAS domain-containing protein [Melittangium boletus]|uniref:Anti-sigma factor antagonist n=1 Tax=Melittangium boletus DSM 14713 TaxID=1294270 RepID=A0A250IGM0_9BACT|nr:STAS domain-containing protein [Melittangium boletus]ATB30363.1 anti-sigma factor antagonist [Melittangium boletus DSM 14713]